jgi:histidine triad (HIT) family protein
MADALASGASDRKIIGVRLPSPAHTLRPYRKQISFMAECIFCKIAKKEIPSYLVWEGELFIAFLDVQPVNPGHLLIIPKEHIENVFDMPDGLYEEMWKTAKALSTPLRKAIGSVRVGMVIEGFGVPHVHLHLVPINKAHELDSTRAKPMPAEELAAIAKNIKKEIEKQKLNSNKIKSKQ